MVYVTMAGVPIVVVHGHSNVKEAFGQHQLSARPEFRITNRKLTGGVGKKLDHTPLPVQFGIFKPRFCDNKASVTSLFPHEHYR